ncbi:reticulocalbin-2 [Lepeophtheirus salmonis]|uniref:Calumeninlike [Nasonia vitripennis] n=1 Tax=Lepeophtheirus salmonis TaxID=72036 RepID=A0A0K2T821_LEPSM|nr:reticulocalbin-2-like [Lepeophtheirus salmonis]
MAHGLKDEEAMMSLNENGIKVVPRRKETSYFGTKTKISVVCLTLVLIGVGAALVLGYPRRPSRGHRIHTDFDGDVNNFIMTEEIIHPKDNHLDSIEGHDIILAKVSDLRSSFNNRFPRDHSGGQQYRYNLEEVPESFWRTLTYADRNTDERKIQDIFNGMDINRDSKADPWELHDWIIVVQEAVQSSVHQRQWEQFRKDENDTITWTDYIYQVNPTGKSTPDMMHRFTRAHRRWQHADQNGDDGLDIEEFKIFLFPYTLDRVALNIIIPETMDDLDLNFDGTVSKEEFLQIHSPDQRDKMSEYFENTLDTNNDGYLNSYEITPWVNPEGFVAVKSEVIHLMEVLDADRDKLLSMREIQRNPTLFLASQVTSFGQIYTMAHNLRSPTQ